VSNTGFEDGIDIVGCKNVLIENCFIRTKDDCISPKADVNYFTNMFTGKADIENVTIRNTIIWNGKYGNGVRFGGELNTDYVRNVTFENIDMIHTENPGGYMTDEGSFAIHNDGKAIIENITCRNIRIEDPQKMLFDFSVIASTAPRGVIRNVLMENITVTTSRGALYSTIKGASATENVSNITFKNLVVNGKKITQMSDTPSGDFYVNTNNYILDIKFE
jgi:polygalacturonase